MSNTFRLRNGRILISTEAPGGIYNASQLKKIASLCDGDSVMVKATEDQRLALIVDPEKANSVASELKSMGLGVRHYQDGLHQPVSCIGEMCEYHEQDALGSALDISAALDGIKLTSPLKIGINGCAKCCVPCHTLDVSVVGDSTGYRVSLGGKNSQLPEIASFLAEGVPPTEIPRLITAIVEIYRDKAHENETLQELIDRDGAGAFIKALAPWSQDAAGSGDPFAVDPSSLAEVEINPVESSGVATPETTEITHETEALSDSSHSQEEFTEIPSTIPIESAAPDADATQDVINDQVNHEEDLNVAEMNSEPQSEMEFSQSSIEELPAASIAEPLVMEDSNQSVVDETLQNVPTEAPEIELPESQAEDLLEIEEVSENIATPSEFDYELLPDLQEPTASMPETLASESEARDTIKVIEETNLIESQPEFEETLAEAKLNAGIEAQMNELVDDPLEDERNESTQLLDHATITLKEPSSRKEAERMPELSEETSRDAVATKTPTIQPFKSGHGKKSWSISAFDLDDAGSPVISWSNGVVLTLTQDAIEEGTIKFCGNDIRVTRSPIGINVEIDGMRMFLPTAA